MIKEIQKLEISARKLEPSGIERQELQEQVIQYTEGFLNNIDDIKAYVIDKDKGKALYDYPIIEEPVSLEDAIELIYKNVDTPGLNPASGGHLGYIPGGGIYVSALADYMADITNRYAGVFFASPGAVRMENMLINWMSDLVGYPESSAGNLTSGGSIANLIAIVTARDASKIMAKDYEHSVIYMTEHVHHCVDKAIRIAGLGEAQVRYVSMDRDFRMSTKALQELIKKDKKDNLIPWLLIASAGTTDVGAIDPLDELGDIAKENNLWFHVDGAYGAFFLLAESGKNKFKGIEKSDSVVMDPHKGLFLPYGLGTVILKDSKKLYDSHYYVANYMQDTMKGPEELSPAELSPELTKHFRGLRLWLPLKIHGLAPFRACLEEKLLLAKYFYQEIKKIPGFEIGPEPQLSVVTFRYLPINGRADEFNEKLIQLIHEDGRVFLSSSKLNGNFIIHLAILSFRTHLSTIDLTLQILKEKVEMINSNPDSVSTDLRPKSIGNK